MPHFAGFASPHDLSPAPLLKAAGPGARCHTGLFGSIVTTAASNSGGEPVSVATCPEAGEITVRRGGDPGVAGCSVTLYNDPQKLPAFQADGFGQHSIFTARDDAAGTVYFASDPRLLRFITPGRMDAAALKGYLCFSHAPAPRTIWEGVSVAASSHPDSWKGNEHPPLPGVDDIQTLLRAAVERRLTTKDTGVYLSGGLDSSLIAALLVEAGVRPRLFTLDFGPPFDAELPVARAVADHLGLPITVVQARPRQIVRTAAAAARAMPQPFGDSVCVPLYLLGEAARDFVSEVWNGEGGDQLFGGWANKPMISALTHGGDTSEDAELAEYMETYHRFWGMTDRLLALPLRDATFPISATDWIRPSLDRNAHPSLLHRLRAANLHLKGAQNIAPRMVALGECHGLRVRAPFFDRALTEATFALPPEALLTGASEKHLLKQVAEKYLPSDIVWRQKRGMGVPATEWCLRHGPLGWAVRRRLSPRRLRAQGWLETEPVRRLLRGEDATADGAFRRRRVGEKLWLLYMLHLWCDSHNITEVG